MADNTLSIEASQCLEYINVSNSAAVLLAFMRSVRRIFDLWAGTVRSRREPYLESKEPGKPQESESSARNVLDQLPVDHNSSLLRRTASRRRRRTSL